MAKKRTPKSKRDLERRPPFRTVPDRVLIVTEGSKTEPSYFRMLIAELELTTATVTIVGDGGSAPISVVEEAEKRLNRDDDFEQIYCIFDRDRHASYADALKALQNLSAKKNLNGKTILAATSVPCFELWYLLHLSDSRKPYESGTTSGSPANALISELKKLPIFDDYEKNYCESFFFAISDHRDSASRRAERFLVEARSEGAIEFYENPSTRVHIVVNALTEISINQRKDSP